MAPEGSLDPQVIYHCHQSISPSVHTCGYVGEGRSLLLAKEEVKVKFSA